MNGSARRARLLWAIFAPGAVLSAITIGGVLLLAGGPGRPSLLALVLLAAVTTFGAAVWLSLSYRRVMLTPLQEIGRVVRDVTIRLTSGEGSLRLRPEDKVYLEDDPEVGQLAADINAALRAVSDRIGRLEEAERRSAIILDHLSDGVLLVDARGRVVTVNPAASRMLRLSKPPAGQFLLSVLPSSELDERLTETLRTGQEASLELERGFDRPAVMSLQLVPVSRDGQIDGVLIVARDVTRAREIERLRADFVANASHELQTPLTSLRGFAETLLDGALNDPEKARRFVEIIYRETDRLSSLVDDLLDLSRIEQGRMRPQREPAPLGELVDAALQLFGARAEAAGVRLESRIPADLPLAYIDRSQISRVLVNLLDNALKYTPPGGRVVVGAADEGSHLRAWVADTGPGIPEEERSRIFERFYRLDKARSRESGGTGLGLSIVKHIVEAHGGGCQVRETPGGGTTIEFTLPRSRPGTVAVGGDDAGGPET